MEYIIYSCPLKVIIASNEPIPHIGIRNYLKRVPEITTILLCQSLLSDSREIYLYTSPAKIAPTIGATQNNQS